MSPPRIFYLNERHELERGEWPARGRTPTFVGIDWATKAHRLLSQIHTVERSARKYRHDPTRKDRVFLVATPEPTLARPSSAKDAVDGRKERRADFMDEDSRVLNRLGFDVLTIAEDGKAILHLDRPRLEQVESRLALLDKSGKADKNRWAPVEALMPTTPEDRIDLEWLQPLPPEDVVEFVAKLPAVLTPLEAEAVQRALAHLLERGRGENLSESGVDLSGRAWLLGTARPGRLRVVAEELQALHLVMKPIRVASAAATPRANRAVASRAPSNAPPEPVVAVVDGGVPEQHRWLKDFRTGRFTLGHPSHADAHGSKVAGIIVHGYVAPGDPMPPGDCAFVDVNVANPVGGAPLADRVIEAIRTSALNAPDARTINISLGSKAALAQMTSKQRRECLRLTRDLDNLAAALDIAIVVASGNTVLQPELPYPEHFLEDPRWYLGTWAPGANVTTVGAFASPEQILGGNTTPAVAGWPSPFSRSGRSPIKTSKPDFSAPGGALHHGWRTGRGNRTYDERGLVDAFGTSFAAPLVSREFAFVLHALQKVCPEGVKAFAVTARAVLTLCSARPTPESPASEGRLFRETLGRGLPSASALTRPSPDVAIVVWQGEIETVLDVVRVTVPLPKAWLEQAKAPRLRMVWAWDSPVEHETANWTCRSVTARLRAALDEDTPSLKGRRTKVGAATAWREETYALTLPLPTSDEEAPLESWPEDGLWSVSLRYSESAPPPALPAFAFSTRQRVGLAIELTDSGGIASPQPHLQTLELAATMDRLSVALTTPTVVTLPNPLR